MPPSAEPARILVVEDEFLVALMIEETVRRLGHEVTGPVGDLASALRLAEDGPVSAAILDVHLQRGERVYPVMKVLRRRGIPFVLTTAYRESELDPDCAGEMLLRKPFDEHDLKRCIDSLLQSVPTAAGNG